MPYKRNFKHSGRTLISKDISISSRILSIGRHPWWVDSDGTEFHVVLDLFILSWHMILSLIRICCWRIWDWRVNEREGGGEKCGGFMGWRIMLVYVRSSRMCWGGKVWRFNSVKLSETGSLIGMYYTYNRFFPGRRSSKSINNHYRCKQHFHIIRFFANVLGLGCCQLLRADVQWHCHYYTIPSNKSQAKSNWKSWHQRPSFRQLRSITIYICSYFKHRIEDSSFFTKSGYRHHWQ